MQEQPLSSSASSSVEMSAADRAAAAELDARRRPTQASVASKDVKPMKPAASKPVDIGEVICRPFVRCIPRSISPNQITFVNHLMNWLFMALAISSRCTSDPRGVGDDTASAGLAGTDASAPADAGYSWGSPKVQLLLAAGVVNFICMMLDCLDGMHARASGQCSKVG